MKGQQVSAVGLGLFPDYRQKFTSKNMGISIKDWHKISVSDYVKNVERLWLELAPVEDD